MQLPRVFLDRNVYVEERDLPDDKLLSVYHFTGLILPMVSLPFINVPQSLNLKGLSQKDRLQELDVFSGSVRGLSHTVFRSLYAGRLGGVLHTGIDRVDLLGDTATITSDGDTETARVRNQLAENVERAVGGRTLGLIHIVPRQFDVGGRF